MSKPIQIQCPNCGKPHLDEGEWVDRKHHVHQCVTDSTGKPGCGHTWDVGYYSRGVAQNYIFAQVGYEAYAKACGGVAVNGDKLPTWNELRPKIQDNWLASIDEVIDTYVRSVTG